MHHLLRQMPYEEVQRERVTFPTREHHEDYRRTLTPPELMVPEAY
jgi:acyl-CoA thioesterase FadM